MQSFLLETCLLTNINISLLTQEEWKWALGQPTGRERGGERKRERERGRGRGRGGERRARQRQTEQVRKSEPGKSWQTCSCTATVLSGARVLTSTELSASTSPWAGSLYCRGDSMTSSFLSFLPLVLYFSACILHPEP